MDNDFDLDDIRKLLQEEIQKAFARSSQGKLLTRKEAAQYLNIAENTLACWAMRGVGPAPTKLGSRSMYQQEILDQYIKDCTMPR